MNIAYINFHHCVNRSYSATFELYPALFVLGHGISSRGRTSLDDTQEVKVYGSGSKRDHEPDCLRSRSHAQQRGRTSGLETRSEFNEVLSLAVIANGFT